MATILQTVGRWFGWGGALGENVGQQITGPSAALVPGTRVISADGALQLAAMWACIERRANTVASLPYFAYKQGNGQKTLARTWQIYESPALGWAVTKVWSVHS